MQGDLAIHVRSYSDIPQAIHAFPWPSMCGPTRTSHRPGLALLGLGFLSRSFLLPALLQRELAPLHVDLVSLCFAHIGNGDVPNPATCRTLTLTLTLTSWCQTHI